jgi:hypothetical protein
MIKKTVVAGIAAVAVAGVLGGAALTSAAGADTPRTPTAAGDVTAQYSKGFNMFNTIKTTDLQLIGLEGNHEGAPAIGSSMAYGEFQRFEAQYAGGALRATYQLNSHIYGNVGTFKIEMEYDFFRIVSARIVENFGMAITHPGDETWGIQYATK